MYTLNDFFCGCGGLGLGFQNAGFKIVGAWDFDKYAVATYRENVGDHVVQADIQKMHIEDVPKADVWAFGFPCQDLSVAGKQAGIKLECADCGTVWEVSAETYSEENLCPGCGGTNHKAATRSGMFFEIMRLLAEAREREPENVPKVLVAENVKALRKLLPVLEAEYGKAGYKCHAQLFNSKYWGVPQNRERYIVVGTLDSLPDTYTYPEEQHDYVPKLSTILEADVDDKFYIADEKAHKIIDQALQRISSMGKVHATITPDRVDKRQNGRRSKEDEDPMFTLTAQDLHGVIVDDTYGYPTEREREPQPQGLPRILQVAHKGSGGQKGWIHHTAGIVGAVTATDYKDPKYILEERGEDMENEDIKVVGLLDISSHDHSRRVHDPEGISPTATAVAGGTHHIKIFDHTKYRVRKLTPTEYGRLQAFPMDNWKQVVSNSQAYKQFGNAVTVTLAEGIGKSVIGYLDSVLGGAAV